MISEENLVIKNNLVEMAYQAFADTLKGKSMPQATDIEMATQAARFAVFAQLSEISFLSEYFPHLSEKQQQNLYYELPSLAPSLTIAPPPLQLQLSPLRLALVAVIGLLLGAFLVTPPFAYLLQMRDVGLLLGSTLGAFLSVWFAIKIIESTQVRNLVNNFLALSATGEVFTLILQTNLFSDLWKRLGNQTEKKFAARFALYLLLLFLRFSANKTKGYDDKSYAQIVRSQLTTWLEGLLKAISLYHLTPVTDANAEGERLVARLGRKMLDLQRSSPEDLPIVLSELLSEAENLGYLFPPKPADFIWQKEPADRYEYYGAIDMGDLVKEEKPPVIYKNKVFEKGLVRKIRS